MEKRIPGRRKACLQLQNNLLCLELKVQDKEVKTDKWIRDKLGRVFEHYAKDYV